MYPVKLGFEDAVKRVRKLIKNGHDAEALLTAMFTAEKTLYRTLRQLVISSGFPSTQADVLMSKFKGIENIKSVWACFDPKHEKLSDFMKQGSLKSIANAQTMRNKLVHGIAVYSQDDCQVAANDVLTALDDLRITLDQRYGFDGWSAIKRRIKSTLHSDPHVKT
jgi:hypothetical protein